MLESGEVFARIRPRLVSDGLAVPMQIQLIEPEQVPLLDADVYTGLPVGSVIRSGIELNGIGQKTAYWMYRHHPGDKPDRAIQSNELIRVPAEGVIHLFEGGRPGQLRGVPVLAPVLAKLRNLDDFDDSLLERQKIANMFALFIVKPMPSGAADPMTGGPTTYDNAGNPIAGMEPGTSTELLPGEDIKFTDPPQAGAEYDQFVTRQLRMLAAGVGVPFELLASDVKDVSDRSLRLSITDFRRACEARIFTVIVPKLLTPVRKAWCLHAALGGQLSAVEAQEGLAVQWQPMAWPVLHPTQDLQAMKLAVESGFRSRSSVIASFGDDPDAVDQERADDKARADSLGLATTDEQLAAAELAKLEAEAEVAQKQADAATAAAGEAKAKAAEAKANTAAMTAQRSIAEASRPYELETAKDRAKAARLEVRAAEAGLKEIMGGIR
jgi:lambda family phage portal protein